LDSKNKLSKEKYSNKIEEINMINNKVQLYAEYYFKQKQKRKDSQINQNDNPMNMLMSIDFTTQDNQPVMEPK
jgi:hypothetical protein